MAQSTSHVLFLSELFPSARSDLGKRVRYHEDTGKCPLLRHIECLHLLSDRVQKS